jgi:phage-related minor tail protein
MVLGIGLGVENRCFLYINQYLQTLGAKRTADKLAADQQAKDDAVAATGAEIAKVEALANAAKDAADDAQAAAGAALDTANKAAGAADQAAQAAADAATANAEDTALLKEQMALLEARLTLVLNTGISELQVSVGQQIASIESVNGILAKMQDDLKYVTGLAESNNNTIQYLGSKDAKGSLDKMNPTSPSWSNLGGILS